MLRKTSKLLSLLVCLMLGCGLMGGPAQAEVKLSFAIKPDPPKPWQPVLLTVTIENRTNWVVFPLRLVLDAKKRRVKEWTHWVSRYRAKRTGTGVAVWFPRHLQQRVTPNPIRPPKTDSDLFALTPLLPGRSIRLSWRVLAKDALARIQKLGLKVLVADSDRGLCVVKQRASGRFIPCKRVTAGLKSASGMIFLSRKHRGAKVGLIARKVRVTVPRLAFGLKQALARAKLAPGRQTYDWKRKRWVLSDSLGLSSLLVGPKGKPTRLPGVWTGLFDDFNRGDRATLYWNLKSAARAKSVVASLRAVGISVTLRMLKGGRRLSKSLILRINDKQIASLAVILRKQNAILALSGSRVTVVKEKPASLNADIYLAPLKLTKRRLAVGTLTNITAKNPGYDNQPHFLPDGKSLFYSSIRSDGQSDVYRYFIGPRRSKRITRTAEHEYSPTVTPDGRHFSTVRIEIDKTQRLWQFPLAGGRARLVLPSVRNVGYHAWGDARTLMLFIVGKPHRLVLVDRKSQRIRRVATKIGRSLHKIPGKPLFSFVQKVSANEWWIASLDPKTLKVERLIRTPKGSEDYCWASDGSLLIGSGSRLLRWLPGRDTTWQLVADLKSRGIKRIGRLAVSRKQHMIAIVGLK